ncbi:unknown protein [Parachlamydia acanthamoebae UV-7]|uniref:Uncharacterized protein n=1 Tax=Parachlamydia acanthamoebae (strain UV7) TaxID=765952 RepID=F8KWP7_PARAV|nr:unknown protein [Parachlamydia acanthamoebae UV-7]
MLIIEVLSLGDAEKLFCLSRQREEGEML